MSLVRSKKYINFPNKKVNEHESSENNTTHHIGRAAIPWCEEDQASQLNEAVFALKKQGFNPQDIVVLITKGYNKSAIYQLASIAKEKLIKHTGEYNKKAQVYTGGTLTIYGIFRFKRQQAPAVIVVDVDRDPEKAEYAKKLLYACITHASVSLTVLAKKDNAFNQRFIKK